MEHKLIASDNTVIVLTLRKTIQLEWKYFSPNWKLLLVGQKWYIRLIMPSIMRAAPNA